MSNREDFKDKLKQLIDMDRILQDVINEYQSYLKHDIEKYEHLQDELDALKLDYSNLEIEYYGICDENALLRSQIEDFDNY